MTRDAARNAIINATTQDDALVLRYTGRLDAAGVAAAWSASLEALNGGDRDRLGRVLVDASGVSFLDGAGAALLLRLQWDAARLGMPLEIRGLDERYARLLESIDAEELHDAPSSDDAADRRGLVSQVGSMACDWCAELRELVVYVGESAAMLGWALRHPAKVRWHDVWFSSLQVGVNSLPILLLIGFLIGLIMSFQSAVSLQRFAAEIFVPNMLGLVMFREMGALVTAILLAARSGSAFAAEIGTMKVNEEVDALVTMGLSPMRFLVLPKVLATVFMVPVMTMFFNFASLLGGAVVMLALGFPLATFTGRVFMNTKFLDFSGGMLKVMVFSLLVAGIGCLRGMQTRSGAGAVGVSTTRAVVSGLILIAVADGIFAVAFFFLGI